MGDATVECEMFFKCSASCPSISHLKSFGSFDISFVEISRRCYLCPILSDDIVNCFTFGSDKFIIVCSG